MKERKFTVGSLLPEQSRPKKNTDRHEEKRKNENRQEPMVKIIQGDQSYTVKRTEDKTTLLEAALKQNQTLDYKCQKGTCGKCEVTIVSGDEWLSSPTEKEKLRIAESMGRRNRLACQASFTY